MGQDLKFIVFNGDEAFAGQLRASLLKFEEAKIVTEVSEPAHLAQAISQYPVDILLVNLDPQPEALLPLLADLAVAHRHLAIFAASESSEGSLILKVMRLGVKEFLCKPIDQNILAEAIHRVTSLRVESVSQGKLITILGTAGGVGATTLAANLAVELGALASGSVSIVDLDYRFGQVATLLDVEPAYTLEELCASPEQLEPSVLTRALAKHPCGVGVLSRPADLAGADTITEAACMRIFSILLNMNEYVVADGPLRFDLADRSILALSDLNLLVVQQLVPCVRNAMRIIEDLRGNGHNLDRTKLICNRTGRESGHLSVQQVTETLGLELFASIPNDWIAVSGSINLGEPLLANGPKTKVRLAIQEIADRVHRGDAQADDKSAHQKKGFIGRMLAAS